MKPHYILGPTKAPSLNPAPSLSLSLALSLSLGLILSLSLGLLASCSAVFTASITGTVIDKEDYEEDNSVTGIANARVFLYTEEEAWDGDYEAYQLSSVLPDAEGKAASDYLYFQSTVTDEDGSYQFSGFVWETFYSHYGKTADRCQVYLLIYHPDYGLWKNPSPLFVVSDVTAQLDNIQIEDLWNQDRFSGSVVNWSDGKALANVTVSCYVAESWTYDSDGAIVADSVSYPTEPSVTATSDADGRWSTDIQFAMRPNREDDRGTAPVRVGFSLDNYRANDPNDKTGLNNPDLISSVDLDRDGASADQGDYGDAFLLVTAQKESDDHAQTAVGQVTMQRHSFSASLSGRVKSGSAYVNGVKLILSVPASGDDMETYSAFSAKEVNGDVEMDGSFDLGTVEWEMADISDGDGEADQDEMDGRVPVSIAAFVDDAQVSLSGGPSALEPSDAVVLELSY